MKTSHLLLAFSLVVNFDLSYSQEHPVNRLINEAADASNAGDNATACKKGKQALAIARKDKSGTPAVIKLLTDFNNGVCQNTSNSSNDECVQYRQAKQTCAPAADFPACMHRLGMASEIKRMTCGNFLSADGW